MEMESSRRSIDRSREPGAKKPRLVEDRSLNGTMDNRERERSFPSSRVPSGTGGLPTTGQGQGQGQVSVSSRFKVNERERDVERSNSSRGGVQLQQQQQQQKPQQQNHELVSQYKTALAELTFNSKPIITNLTIIAGENLHVAKWIAATVCANILEVPSEQKLPSLYLLDSIVKNIGRDYIKYFAAKLPEVFCKAYRQVDSSVHPGMRHLFGTWKSVFPPACLQMIEKELGFSPANPRSEPQSQRPPHSIHVNPEYLEARKRSLQESNRVKAVNVNSGSSVPSDDDDDDDAEKPDGNTITGSERPWTDRPVKGLKHPKREASTESFHEKNTAGYEDNDYSSDLSRNSDLGYARVGERVLEQDGSDKSWFGANTNATEAVGSQRNTFDNQREFTKYRDPRPGAAAPQLQQKGPTQSAAQSGRLMNKNWKTSEEEEYMWDDMSSRFPKKERWTGDAEKMEFEDHLSQPHGEIDIGSRVHGDALVDSLSSTHRGQTAFGHRIPLTWPPRESHPGNGSKVIGRTSRISGQSEEHPSSLGGLSATAGSSLARIGLQTPSGLSAGVTPTVESLLSNISSAGILGQKRHQPQQAASPSVQSSMNLPPSSPSSSHRLHHESNNLTEDDRLQTRSNCLPGQSTAHHQLLPNRTYHAHPVKSSFPSISQAQSGGLQNFQSQPPQHMQNPSSSMQISQRQHHSPFSLQSLPDLVTSRSSGHIQKQLPHSSVIGNPPKVGHSLLNHSSNPSMDIAGHSNTSSMLANLIKSGVFANNSVTSGFPNTSFQDLSTLTPQLGSRPPLPSGPPPIQLASSAPMVTPASVLDSLTTQPLRTAALPPLPPGPPPASSVSGGSQTLANSSPMHLDFLLNSLVGKGLISTAKESLAHTAPELLSQPRKQSPAPTTSSSVQATCNPSTQTLLTSSSGNDFSFPESPRSQVAPTGLKDLIGTEFKADVIRQSHLSVISGLHCLPHQCNICGLRLKYRERLDRHMEWHALRKQDTNMSIVSRRWYANLGDWVNGSTRSLPGPSSLCSAKSLVGGVEKNESGVPADETQLVCMLCGEIFEDFYSLERDEWMFKGAAYLPLPAVGGEVGDEGRIIVHKNCITPTSVYDLGLIKQEQING